MDYLISQQPDTHLLKKENENLQNQLDKKDETILALNQIIDQVKKAQTKALQEKEDFKNRLREVEKQRDEMETNFEGILRSYKQAIEKKQQELEDQQNKIIPFDNDLQKLKIRNEIEEIYKVELNNKENMIENLYAKIAELKSKIQLEKQLNELQREEFDTEKMQMRQKLKEEIYKVNQRLSEKKDVDNHKEQDRQQIQEFKYETQVLNQSLVEKDKIVKQLRQQIDYLQNDKNKWIEQLTEELETERSKKRMLSTDNERLYQTLQDIQKKQQPQQIVQEDIAYSRKNEIKEQTLRDIQNQLNDYQRLLEEERKSKQQIQQQLNDVIKQLRQEKDDYDKINENKIHDLQLQLKDEFRQKNKLQNKVKELLDQVNNLNEECIELKDRISSLPRESMLFKTQKEYQSLKEQLELKLKQDIPQITETNEKEQDYKITKLKTKNKKLKEKLQQANNKIMMLLNKRLESQKDSGLQKNLQEAYEQSISVQNKFQDYFRLRGDVDYLNNPYGRAQQQQISRDPFPQDMFNINTQKDINESRQRMEELYNKTGNLYSTRR